MEKTSGTVVIVVQGVTGAIEFFPILLLGY